MASKTREMTKRRTGTAPGATPPTARGWPRAEAPATFVPAGTFRKSATTIARVMAAPEVSPKGIGSAIRTIQFLLNRSGKNLPPDRRRELERAKHLLQKRLEREKS